MKREYKGRRERNSGEIITLGDRGGDEGRTDVTGAAGGCRNGGKGGMGEGNHDNRHEG